jgi:ABC-type sugar transport system substrate-binding protein
MKQIKAGGLYRATFLYNPNMAASAVTMARLIALGQGFPELSPPAVPRQLIVPAAVVTKDNVASPRSTPSTETVVVRDPPIATLSGPAPGRVVVVPARTDPD